MKPNCPVCGEARITKTATVLLGRACKCERDKQTQAKLDREKPRCGRLITEYPSYWDRCGDHEGHGGPCGLTWIEQVQKSDRFDTEFRNTPLEPRFKIRVRG